MKVYPLLLYILFSCKFLSFLLVPADYPYLQCIIVLNASFLMVSFYCKHSVIFFEHTVVLTFSFMGISKLMVKVK